MKTLFILLVAGFVFFGSIFVADPGVGLYVKRSPGFDHMYVNAGGPPYNIERLLKTVNQRYVLLLIGYSEKGGLKLFQSMPALP